MEFFFKPRGMAIVGATANPKKGGYSIVYNARQGFKGKIYPVNPRYREIDGLPCFPSIMEVPDPVDMAILFVPAVTVPDMAAQCARRGIRGIMSHPDLAQASNAARAARKPLFCWLLGRKREFFEFKGIARRHGIPVYKELHRTVECMAALFRYRKTLQRRGETPVPPILPRPRPFLESSSGSKGST